MTEDPHIRGYRLYQAALKLSSDRREAFLAGHEDSDREAVAVARAALALDADPTGIDGSSLFAGDRRREDRVGSVVAGWRIERRLGIGGFGRVYQASRISNAGPEMAAIKFLDIAPDQVERFRRERQFLATFDHPGIPRFHDAGAEEGVPYVIMEYVSGLPITLHCNRFGLSLSKRLELFVKVCRIVEYAHERVIHRDLKPENILVTDGGQPYLLDLGLARSLDPDDSGQMLTRTPLFTKAYASPEQVLLQPVSWATDIYALGVILYEMVTGRRPLSDFALSGDWKQAICDQLPMRPSEAVRIGHTIDANETTGLPGQSSAALGRELTGDLDGVILKALNKNPTDRYPSVRDLRDEIERFQNGFPVTAHDSGWIPRAWKWSRKNRGTAALLAASSLFMVLVAHFGALRKIEYDARYTDELNAVRRVEFLLRPGLPEIEKSLAADRLGAAIRATALDIHRDLLRRAAGLPESALLRLDPSLIESAVECGMQSVETGDPAGGLEATDAAVRRAEYRYRTEPDRAIWRLGYANLLRQRIRIYALLGRDRESAQAAERLAGIDKRGP